jgi:acyl-coenzyme A synthetase/AMP-(fatty) acid ligase
MNIIDPILHQCRVNAEQPAICVPGTHLDVVTYAQLEYVMNNVVLAVLPYGFEPGRVVGVMVRDTIFHIALSLALARIGVISFSWNGTSLPPEIGATAVITDTFQQVTGVHHVIHASPEWMKSASRPEVVPRPFRATGAEVCRIFSTSGTAGASNYVALSHRSLIVRNMHFYYSFGGHWPDCARLYCDLPIASEPAFRFLLYMLTRGGMIMFYGRDHVSTVQSLDLYKVQGMVTSPRGLTGHLRFYEESAIYCRLTQILALGGNVPAELLERIWARMCPQVSSAYGMTEVGFVAAADLRCLHKISGGVGYVIPPALVQVVDEYGMQMAEDDEGILRLRAPDMSTVYLGQQNTTAETFKSGWFYPGDRGYITREGLIVVTKRKNT